MTINYSIQRNFPQIKWNLIKVLLSYLLISNSLSISYSLHGRSHLMAKDVAVHIHYSNNDFRFSI